LAVFFAAALPTVNTHISRIFEMLHVRSRSQAVAKFMNIPNVAVAK
jgi:DNA-binding CsgD family transcriptional regulator